MLPCEVWTLGPAVWYLVRIRENVYDILWAVFNTELMAVTLGVVTDPLKGNYLLA